MEEIKLDISCQDTGSDTRRRLLEGVAVNRKNEKKIEKVTKSAWGMPWLSEAMKDVISCDKLRGGANNH